jgi:amino-acid N-acetyltransferase
MNAAPAGPLPARAPLLVRSATEADNADILRLLSDSGLPTSDLATSGPGIVVACEGSEVVGVGGLEVSGPVGLVRSLAVRTDRRGRGVGTSILQQLEARAREKALAELVLLTETAAPFFARHGFGRIERQSAPAAARASEQFRSLRCASAECMSMRLDVPAAFLEEPA